MSIAIQYSQFSSRARVCNHVASRLNQVVNESSNGQAASVSRARKWALTSDSAVNAIAERRWRECGQRPTGNSPSTELRVQLHQPYTDMPTKNTCNPACIGSC